MSRFTRRRKAIRQKQGENKKRWEENSKKLDKWYDDMMKTLDYLKINHPEFDSSLNNDERVKLFGKIFNQIHNDT